MSSIEAGAQSAPPNRQDAAVWTKCLLPLVLGLLGYGFWHSPEFMEIASGVAIFLFGMFSLERGFHAFSGGLLEKTLQRSTDRFWKSLSFGIVSTTLMQSSSLVSVITISFLSAGMIGLRAGLGIIFGANLGTTTGAWLVAGVGLKVKISAFALPMLVFGVILAFQRSKALKGIGNILAGLGFLFLGIHFMKEGFETFKSTIDLAAYAIPGYRGLFTFLLIGIIATVVMQSSHATLVLVITALASGQITYDNALALAIGANIGTTITAIIGAMGANVEGKRLAGGHLIFNVITGLIAIAAIHPFAAAVGYVSDYAGIPAADHSLRLAVFHTLFNLVGVIVMTPVLGPMARLLALALPTKEIELTRPRFLTEEAVEFPETALKATRQETDHLFDNAFVLLAHGIDLHRGEILSDRDLAEVLAARQEPIEIEFDADYSQTVKVLYGAIVEFVTRAQAQSTPKQGEQIHRYRVAARHIVESVKCVKHLRKNLTVYIKSDNPHIRQAYVDIQINLGNVMRELAGFRRAAGAGEAIDLTKLDALRRDVQAADVLANGTIDQLIRADLISGTMASSLMNDSSYNFYTVNHLVATAEALYEPAERREVGAPPEGTGFYEDTTGQPVAVAEIAAAQPRFLSGVTPGEAAAALEATRSETLNLYDRAREILSAAIGFRPGEVQSVADLQEIVETRLAPIEYNIDQHYEKTVKVLYAAITRFVSKVRAELSDEERCELLALRDAAGEVVEAVKCVKHLRKNLTVHLASSNTQIRQGYAEIRLLLGSVMRGLHGLRTVDASSGDQTTTCELRKRVKAADILANGSLDELVYNDLITPWMATSLINDSAYARHASIHLLNMAERVLLTRPGAFKPPADPPC